MKANRAARHRADEAGAQVISALILFGIFVTTIAILNVSAVPNAGRAAEEEHWEQVLSALNGLQAEAEAADDAGATVARSIELAPDRTIGQDFFSYFLATPARASGEIAFEPDYGNVTLSHTRNGAPTTYYDIGSATSAFAYGRVTFDQHPVFRTEGVVQLETGGVVTTPGAESMRFDPPFSVSVSGSTTYLAVKARVINGSAFSIGGTAPVRLLLTTEASTLIAPENNNADAATLRLETDHGTAWKTYLEGLASGAGLTATQSWVRMTAGSPDVVTWSVNGTASGNDVRLTSGVLIHGLSVS